MFNELGFGKILFFGFKQNEYIRRKRQNFRVGGWRVKLSKIKT